MIWRVQTKTLSWKSAEKHGFAGSFRSKRKSADSWKCYVCFLEGAFSYFYGDDKCFVTKSLFHYVKFVSSSGDTRLLWMIVIPYILCRFGCKSCFGLQVFVFNNRSFFRCIKFVDLEERHRTARNDCDELRMQIRLKSLFHRV